MTSYIQPDEAVAEPEEDGADGALSPRQELALQALLSSPTQKLAALAAGCSETTLWRYMTNPTFARRLREARRHSVDHAALCLQRETAEAVSVLRELMTKSDAPAAARISAARSILDYSFRIVEIDELKTRMEEFEEFMRAKQEREELGAASKESAICV
jgi:hypothetical protein